MPRWRRAGSGPSVGSPREVTPCPVRACCRSSPRRCRPRSWRRCPSCPLRRANPRPVRLPAAAVVHLVRDPRTGSACRGPARPRRAVHPRTRRAGLDGLLDRHDDARGARVLPVRVHRWPDQVRPAVYARLPKVHRDESRTQGLDRLELIRLLQIAQTITVHPAPWPTCWGSTPCAPPKPRRCGSRTTPTPCAAIGSCTWS